LVGLVIGLRGLLGLGLLIGLLMGVLLGLVGLEGYFWGCPGCCCCWDCCL
jgi:hypothetical protein